MVTLLVEFTSSDVTVLHRLSKVRVMSSVGQIEKFSIWMVEVPFQNNESRKGLVLVRKSEKMCLSQNFQNLGCRIPGMAVPKQLCT